MVVASVKLADYDLPTAEKKTVELTLCVSLFLFRLVVLDSIIEVFGVGISLVTIRGKSDGP